MNNLSTSTIHSQRSATALFSRLPLGLFLETPSNFSDRPGVYPPAGHATSSSFQRKVGLVVPASPGLGSQRNSVKVPEIVTNRAECEKVVVASLFKDGIGFGSISFMQQENKNLCTLYLVRHGETEWNKSGIVMGQSDSPLTETGLEQAKATADELKNIHFDAIFSSDLHRAKRTAEIIKLERQLAIQTSKALRERTFGHYEGTSGEEYRKKFQLLFDTVKKLSEKEQKEFKFDQDVESDEEVISRFITQLREIAIAYPNKTVLVVSHGGCIRTFLMHTGYVKYGELPVGSFSNAGYAKVLSDGVDFFIKETKGIKK